MLNHAIYKSCLFLSGGAVEKVTGTSDLEKMGGYAKVMPITFMAFLIGSLSISGVPPFNGFASKWLVYQGVIEAGRDGGFLWVVWLVAAMLGSALTLASFMKLLHAVFLGTPSKEAKAVQVTAIEVGPGLWLPPMILAVLCVIFGIFAAAIPLAWFIYPSLPFEAIPTGLWSSGAATALLIFALIIGLGIYWWGAHGKVRTVENFVGGESLRTHPEMRVSGVEFYRTVEETGGLRALYRGAERKFFDLYDVGRNITFSISHGLSFLHSGVLPLYLGWCLLGLVILLFILLW
jgi:NADH:ubiquinone oxidoreductase subunit 5 (subunit L)/multisubunit Na+/H+ antiporter MnhA subunit